MESLTELETLIEQAGLDLRNGKPVLVADSRERENEVDAIVAGQTVLTQWMAWMIRYSSGYICAPMPNTWADRLGLPVQWANNEDPKQTCYTVSCDAASGVTTGISAADRCHTLRVLADPQSEETDLIRPGHILPLRSRDGGLSQRDGHTEAAVELMQIAQLSPVAAIGELVLDDGTMMRYEQAVSFAKAHHLTLLTVAEIKDYLNQVGANQVETKTSSDSPGAKTESAQPNREKVEYLGSAILPTVHGEFRTFAFRDNHLKTEHLALVPNWYIWLKQQCAGESEKLSPLYQSLEFEQGYEPSVGSGYQPQNAPVVRVHSECLTGEALGSLRCDCGPQLDTALAEVMRQGGVVVYLRGQEGRGIGLGQKILAYNLQDQGQDTVEANISLGWPADLRDYNVAGEILSLLAEEEVRLLTNNPLKNELGKVTVSEIIPLEVGVNPHNLAYLQRKQAMGHRFIHDMNTYEPNREKLGEEE